MLLPRTQNCPLNLLQTLPLAIDRPPAPQLHTPRNRLTTRIHNYPTLHINQVRTPRRRPHSLLGGRVYASCPNRSPTRATSQYPRLFQSSPRLPEYQCQHTETNGRNPRRHLPRPSRSNPLQMTRMMPTTVPRYLFLLPGRHQNMILILISNVIHHPTLQPQTLLILSLLLLPLFQ